MTFDVNIVAQEHSGVVLAQGGSDAHESDNRAVITRFFTKFPQGGVLWTFAGVNVPFGQTPLSLVGPARFLNEEDFSFLYDPRSDAEVT